MNRSSGETVRPVMYSLKMLNEECSMKNEGREKKIDLITVTEWVAFFFLVSIFILIMSGSADAQVKLKGKIPDLCFDCHQALKKGQSDEYVHFLFKGGKCTTCHNSHASKTKGLMADEVDALCKGCHKEIKDLLENAIMHGALRENNCTECHVAHSGEVKHLLIKEEKSLCMSCHEDLTPQFRRPYICLPFKEGKCSSCHNSHASPVDNLLASVPNSLCRKCHGPACKAGKVSISSAVKDTDCTTCHSGHSSFADGLLGPFGHTAFLEKDCDECHNPIKSAEAISTKMEGSKLCFSCHQRNKSKFEYIDSDVHVKDIQNPCIFCHDHHASSQKNLTKKESGLCIKCHESTERRTAAMERALRSIQCEPVKDRKCFECHIPGHSSRPLNYREDEMALCARCHAAQHKISHPLGADIKDPRDGSPLTCNSCHSMHSAGADFMLTHDRKRELCIQCHKM
jgi:predicted CXXCH cytochrome family protein